MPRSAIRLGLAAVAEAREARRWYGRDSAVAAEGFVAELDRSLELIAEAPLRWPAYEAGTHRLVMRRYPYAVIYRLQGGAIQVVAIAHTRRRPGYWTGRR
jgi:plasmid stabilization system protein ParE